MGGKLRLTFCCFVFVVHVLGADGKIDGCKEPFTRTTPHVNFEVLRQTAWRYYQHGVFEFTSAEVVSNVVGWRPHLIKLCPAAVLQALLMKLEENMVYESEAYQALMYEYMKIMHNAVLEGTITPEDLNAWPLQQGLEVVQTQHTLLSSKGRGTRTAMVLNFCQAQDRFGRIHEMEWMLRPPFGDPAESAKHNGSKMGLLRNVSLYLYLVDAPKCKWLKGDLAEKLQRAFQEVHLIPYKGGPTREEQSAYFKFLEDHYENLPDYTIFVHPDAPEHQLDDFPALTRALKLIRTDSELAQLALQYYPLATQFLDHPRRMWGDSETALWTQFWNETFDQPWSSYNFKPARCMWNFINGTIIGDSSLEGSVISRRAAKEACISAGTDCAGITCGLKWGEHVEMRATDWHDLLSPIGGCLVRINAGRQLVNATGATIGSYIKDCPENVPDAREDEYESNFGTSHKQNATSTRSKNAFSEHRNTYLPGHAAGDLEERTFDETSALCSELGAACTGITCSRQGVCTVRGGLQPLESPFGEISYLKEKSRLPAPQRGEGSFSFYGGSQAIVHRSRIQALPKRVISDFAADKEICSKYTGLYEATWHAIFGEPLAQPTRERNPALPLYLKWDVPSRISFGDEWVL